MSIQHAPPSLDLLSFGMNEGALNKTKAERNNHFRDNLQSFSTDYKSNITPSRHSDTHSGNVYPPGGSSLPVRQEGQVSSDNVSGTASDLDARDESSDFFERMEKAGLDVGELKKLVTENTDISEEEFDKLMQSPEQFMIQFEEWLKQEGLGEGILAMLHSPMGAEQLMSHLKGTSSSFALGVASDGTLREHKQLARESGEKKQLNELVGRLLQEKDGAQVSMDERLLREKLLEGVVTGKKLSDSDLILQSARVSDLSVSPSIGLQGSVFSQGGASASPPSGHQVLPQLPPLRGIPGQPGSTEGLSERIMIMRSKNMQIAEIKLDPQELGTVEVRIKVVNDVTSIQFHSPNTGVREALESQIARLREMMDSAGLSLGDVGVSDQSLSESYQQDESFHASTGRSENSDLSQGEDGGLSVEIGAVSQLHQGRVIGLVDYFA